MIDTATDVVMVLDASYRWWWRRSFKAGSRLPVAGMLDGVDQDGTKHVLVPASATRYGRLMRSEGLTGWCKPGRYRLLIVQGMVPRLEEFKDAD